MEGSCALALCAPQAEGYHAAGAVADFLGKEAWARIVLWGGSLGVSIYIPLAFLECPLLTRPCVVFFSLLLGLPSTYNDSSVDAHDKVEPRLHGQLRVGVAQDLEAEEALLLILVVVLFLPRVLAVEAGDEAIEGVEHVGHLGSIGLDGLEEELSREREGRVGWVVVLCRTSLLAAAICWPHAR